MGPREGRPANRPLMDIYASMVVERDSQKGIVIGHRGQRLRDVGTAARKQIADLVGMPVYLDLKVKVVKDWQRDPKSSTASDSEGTRAPTVPPSRSSHPARSRIPHRVRGPMFELDVSRGVGAADRPRGIRASHDLSHLLRPLSRTALEWHDVRHVVGDHSACSPQRGLVSPIRPPRCGVRHAPGIPTHSARNP